MIAVIETPKWSFTKISEVKGSFKRAFLSPIPTPFNYGYISGTKGKDGSSLDIIILGEKLDIGSKIDVEIIGKVRFIDNGIEDDKYIATLDGKKHSFSIMLFFSFYALTKLLRNFLSSKKWTTNKYLGTIWFEKGIKETEKLE